MTSYIRNLFRSRRDATKRAMVACRTIAEIRRCNCWRQDGWTHLHGPIAACKRRIATHRRQFLWTIVSDSFPSSNLTPSILNGTAPPNRIPKLHNCLMTTSCRLYRNHGSHNDLKVAFGPSSPVPSLHSNSRIVSTSFLDLYRRREEWDAVE